MNGSAGIEYHWFLQVTPGTFLGSSRQFACNHFEKRLKSNPESSKSMRLVEKSQFLLTLISDLHDRHPD